ncbi:MAG: PhoX family phosphatase, partial [Pseudomonadota bacterium]
MKPIDPTDVSFDTFDEIVNPRPEESDFDRVVEAAISRRGFMGGVLAFGSFAALGSTSSTPATAASDRFGFAQIPTSIADTVTVPQGYKVDVVVRWGDPILPGAPEFDHKVRGTAKSQEMAFGDNNDGMDIFKHDGKLLLVANNEYANRHMTPKSAVNTANTESDNIVKRMMAHGVSVMEVAEVDGKWSVLKDSIYNRRITPVTEMVLTGPAAGHDLLKTDADPTGTKTLGTWNNCGNGVTPWGTYLACEENFNGYFSAEDAEHEVSPELARYGVSARDWGYDWARIDDRFDVAKNPNEPNRVGYVVEIDPTDPSSRPKKRTALGRFKHENAETVVNTDGRVVVYMGDDERGEFLYRYVSNDAYSPGGDTETLLTEGSISAARFNEDGTGEWLELTPEATGMASQSEICVHTRQAASAVGATTMDRPEWV